MELALLLACVLVGVMAGAMAHRHRKAVAWDRELTEAFGTAARPELGSHRAL
jgi:hypothetical protein